MSELKELAMRLKSLNKDNILLLSSEIAEQNKEFFEDSNKDQLLSGKDANEKDINPQYASEAYARRKPRLFGRSLLTPNLKNKGNFHRKITANIRGKEIVVNSLDGKTQKLKEKYGNPIIGVSETNQQSFIDEILSTELRIRILQLIQ